MYRNKLAILASTALTMSLGFAQAADMPVKAPVYKAPDTVPYDPWTGFYLGGNVGYSWGKADATTAVAPFTQDFPLFPFVFPGGGSSTSTKPKGVIGGGQIGYNWKFAPQWLAGIEADFQGSGQKDSSAGLFSGITIGTVANPVCNSSVTCNYTNTTDITAKLSWFGTVRGRVGALWNNMLFYGTGGLAYGKLSVSGTNTFNVICSSGCVSAVTTATYSTPFSYSKTKTGWAAGAGIEGLLGVRNWTWRVEYLHIDLGSIGSGSFGTTPSVTLSTGKFTDEIVRVGLNYRFGAALFP